MPYWQGKKDEFVLLCFAGGDMRGGPSLMELAAEVRDRVSLVDVAGRVTSLREKRRGDWWGCCPFHGERTPSFHVVAGRRRYHCFGCGAGGDVIGFVMAASGRGFRDAVLELANEAGLLPVADGVTRRRVPDRLPRQDRRQQVRDEADYVDWCRAQWSAAVPAAGTLVETYLRSRGIVMAPPASLRFAVMRHSDSGRDLPCMVAAMQAGNRAIVGIHRTFLAADGLGKAEVEPAKKMAGIAKGSAIRLGPVEARMGFGEGIESCLSVMQSCPGLSVWAAGSLGNLAGDGIGKMRPHPRRPGVLVPPSAPDLGRPGVPIPAEVRDVILLGDGDSDPEITTALMERARLRAVYEGRQARVAWAAASMDFNDMLQAAGAALSAETAA